MRTYKPELTDAQWRKVEPLLPLLKPGKNGGRPWADNRATFEGILWILRTGSPWRDLPERYPSPATCWRRLRKWEEEGIWEKAWQTYLGELDDKGVLGWEECFIDATFFAAKRGASESGPREKARERSSWWWQAAAAYRLESTSRLRRLARRLSPKKRSMLYESLDRDPAVLRKLLNDL